jgi:hypothetical protein
MQAIDPMVFVDDDGSALLYWGQGRCKAVKLNDDMISFDMADVRDLTPPGYNEGPFVHKRNGKYYLTWSEGRSSRSTIAVSVRMTPGVFDRRWPTTRRYREPTRPRSSQRSHGRNDAAQHRVPARTPRDRAGSR